MNPAHEAWQGKTVLITGVCGTVGKELLRQLMQCSPARVMGIDNNEGELVYLRERNRSCTNLQLMVGDVRDPSMLRRHMRGIDVVIHSAALKHVIVCEESPREAVQSNVLGTQNIIDGAMEMKVDRVVFTSTDKAVNPTNVMGTSKLMAERLVTAANVESQNERPTFLSTRFGNVLGSRGSVVPVVAKQIADGQPVTLTHRDMTRFIMTLSDAVGLVMDSVFLAKGGEVFVTKMPVARIEDLVEILIEELAPHMGKEASEVRVEAVGPRPGEKMYEELLSDEEVRRTVELPDYFVVLPAFSSVYSSIVYEYPNQIANEAKPYNSAVETAMSREELRTYLTSNSVLEEALREWAAVGTIF